VRRRFTPMTGVFAPQDPARRQALRRLVSRALEVEKLWKYGVN